MWNSEEIGGGGNGCNQEKIVSREIWIDTEEMSEDDRNGENTPGDDVELVLQRLRLWTGEDDRQMVESLDSCVGV